MKNSILLLLCVLLSAIVATAQEKGQVKFMLNPPLLVSELIINGEKFTEDEFVMHEFVEGSYIIRYWSDYYEPLDTLMVVEAGQRMNYKIKLIPDQDYVDFNVAEKKYKRDKITNLYVPGIFTTGMGILTINYLTGSRSFRRQADDIERAYNRAGPYDWEIEFYKNKMDELIRKTRIKRATSALLIASTGVGFYYSVVLAKNFSKRYTKPEFLKTYGLSIEPYSNSTDAGLSLNYKF